MRFRERRAILARLRLSSPLQDGIDTLPGKSKTGKSCLFSAFHEHLSDAHVLVTLISLCPSPPSTPSPPPAHRSAVPCLRTVAWSDGSQPASASSTARA